MRNKKTNYIRYSITPQEIYEDEELGSYEILLYPVLVSLAYTKGSCTATNTYLAKHIRASDSTVKRALDKLEERGYIMRTFDTENDNTSRRIYITKKFDVKIGTSKNEQWQ